MNIYPYMLGIYEEYLQERIIARYMRYPPDNKPREGVLHRHKIGDSQHGDLRGRVTDHLIGWSIVGFSTENPFTLDVLLSGKKLRAEPKCFSIYCNEWAYKLVDVKEDGVPIIEYRILTELSELMPEELASQPLAWLKVKGKVPPGAVGARVEKPGEFEILWGTARAKDELYYFGAQKPLFHEYFIKVKGEWQRIVVRGVRQPRIDPETKKPIPGQYELLWTIWRPDDQLPYCLSKRARQKGWFPPKNIIPVPPELREKYKQEYESWYEWVQEKWKQKPRGTELMSKEISFTLHIHTYKGPRIIRWTPHIEYYLRFDVKGKGKIRSFYIEGNPIRESPLPAIDEGMVERKWFDYEGDVRYPERYMPFKTLIGDMKIIDNGKVTYEVTRLPDGREYISLLFKGKRLKGRWRLVQTEKGAFEYDLEYLDTLTISTELREGRFVYHLHTIADTGKQHYDLRYHFSGDEYLYEFNLYDDLRDKQVDEEVQAHHKKCYDLSWMDIKEPDTVKYVGRLKTIVSPLDSGSIQLIEDTDVFKSFFLHGQQLNGWYVAIKRNGRWYVSKSRLPRPMSVEDYYHALIETVSLTDPLKGQYYRPFRIVQKRGWDYFRVDIYDIKDFSRCEPTEKTPKYLPELEIPAGIREIRIGLFPRKGALHGARVQSVIFDADKWTYEDAVRWIKKNRLHIWLGTQIKERRKE